MEITLKNLPMKVANIPWRNNNLSSLHADPPFSEQGETIIGVYLLVLGELTTYPDFKYFFLFNKLIFPRKISLFLYIHGAGLLLLVSAS